MVTALYDGSFDGFLSAVFAAYREGLELVQIRPHDQAPATLFGQTVRVETDPDRAARVWQGLERRLSPAGLRQFFHNFLAGVPGEEDNLLAFLRHQFAHETSVEGDFTHPAVLRLAQLARQVHREKHRMEAFVRFELSADGVYRAIVAPDFNVLPLIAPHFQSRYADQRWMIGDRLRRYGILYDGENVHFAEMPAADPEYDPKEKLFQQLWKDYFRSTGIPTRKNMRLHRQHVPLRYWKYLTEKQL